MSKKIISTVGIALAVIASIICTLFIKTTSYNFSIIGEKESYSEKFANKNQKC